MGCTCQTPELEDTFEVPELVSVKSRHNSRCILPVQHDIQEQDATTHEPPDSLGATQAISPSSKKMDADEIFDNFRNHLNDGVSQCNAAIKTLTTVIVNSPEQTITGIYNQLKNAASVLIAKSKSLSSQTGKTPISIQSSCDMFLTHINKMAPHGNFEKTRDNIINTGNQLGDKEEESIRTISTLASRIFKDNITVLLHGHSRIVEESLKDASKTWAIQALVTECRPLCEGYDMVESLRKSGVEVELILDSAVASVMDRVDAVLVGSEAVVENGGIVNKIGTYSIALIAKTFQRPLYVMTESLKFMRSYPLSCADLPKSQNTSLRSANDQDIGDVKTPLCDLTPPNLITLLFTDLGIFTPSAVSDELIQLYNG